MSTSLEKELDVTKEGTATSSGKLGLYLMRRLAIMSDLILAMKNTQMEVHPHDGLETSKTRDL